MVTRTFVFLFFSFLLAMQSDWRTVTFRDTCDMMTGNYGSSNYQADEDGAAMVQFFIEETYSGKIGESFSFRNRASPGSTHVRWWRVFFRLLFVCYFCWFLFFWEDLFGILLLLSLWFLMAVIILFLFAFFTPSHVCIHTHACWRAGML